MTKMRSQRTQRHPPPACPFQGVSNTRRSVATSLCWIPAMTVRESCSNPPKMKPFLISLAAFLATSKVIACGWSRNSRSSLIDTTKSLWHRIRLRSMKFHAPPRIVRWRITMPSGWSSSDPRGCDTGFVLDEWCRDIQNPRIPGPRGRRADG